MWDSAESTEHELGAHLSHDMPCQRCGHAVHTYLACSDVCACRNAEMPGAPALALAHA